jgi:hypothetical protein
VTPDQAAVEGHRLANAPGRLRPGDPLQPGAPHEIAESLLVRAEPLVGPITAGRFRRGFGSGDRRERN